MTYEEYRDRIIAAQEQWNREREKRSTQTMSFRRHRGKDWLVLSDCGLDRTRATRPGDHFTTRRLSPRRSAGSVDPSLQGAERPVRPPSMRDGTGGEEPMTSW